jgi:hypothetical protein
VDYITIEVNKRFLIRTTLVLSLIAGLFGSYKFGYKKGATDAIQYVYDQLQPKTLDKGLN